MQRKRILLVDDDKNIHKAIKANLENTKYIIDSAYNGEMALEMIQDNKYTVLVTDIMMPQMNGLELLDKLSTKKQTIPTIVITGTYFLATDFNLSYLGVKKIITKPFDFDEIKESIDMIFHK
jgi:DNA-binding response OmpR family regulator